MKLQGYVYMVILGIVHSQHEIRDLDNFRLDLTSYIWQPV